MVFIDRTVEGIAAFVPGHLFALGIEGHNQLNLVRKYVVDIRGRGQGNRLLGALAGVGMEGSHDLHALGEVVDDAVDACGPVFVDPGKLLIRHQRLEQPGVLHDEAGFDRITDEVTYGFIGIYLSCRRYHG